MDGPGNYHTKGSKSEKEKYDIVHIRNLKKNDTKELIYKIKKKKKTHRLREQTYFYQGNGLGGWIDWEVGIHIHTMVFLKQISNHHNIVNKFSSK